MWLSSSTKDIKGAVRPCQRSWSECPFSTNKPGAHGPTYVERERVRHSKAPRESEGGVEPDFCVQAADQSCELIDPATQVEIGDQSRLLRYVQVCLNQEFGFRMKSGLFGSRSRAAHHSRETLKWNKLLVGALGSPRNCGDVCAETGVGQAVVCRATLLPARAEACLR